MCWLIVSRAAELAFAARTVRRMSGGFAGRKGCEARHNQLARPLGQLSFDARQGHAARGIVSDGACARVVWVCVWAWCSTTQRSTRQQTAVLYNMKLLMEEAMAGGKDEMGMGMAMDGGMEEAG